MLKVSFFVPIDKAEEVKEAMFLAGGGRIGQYDCCCFESSGIGQFRPLKGSNPYIGNQDKIEKVQELKIEMVCEDSLIKEVVKAMKESHPYETPAYDIVKLLDY